MTSTPTMEPAGSALCPSARAHPRTRGRGRRHRRRDSLRLNVSVLSTWDQINEFVPEWDDLYQSSGTGNPYASPRWLRAWARHFLAEADLVVVAVRREEQLVGVAACHVQRVMGLARAVRLWGSGHHDALTELPQVLNAEGEHRSVLRAVTAFWCKQAEKWDWLELPLQHEQGWFEPEWLCDLGGPGIIEHKITRPSVVLSLPVGLEDLHGTLKRNLQESLRRGRNRLSKSGRQWTISAHRGEALASTGWPALRHLHHVRAELAGHRRHPDELADPVRQSFMLDALTDMAEQGAAEILTLDVDGTPIAAQAVLHAPTGTYLGLSGVEPSWWHVGPVTLLQMHAAEIAIGSGRRELNLSTGPSVAKFRWSETVVQHPEFIVCGPRYRSRLAYLTARTTATAASVRREAARHLTVDAPADALTTACPASDVEKGTSR